MHQYYKCNGIIFHLVCRENPEQYEMMDEDRNVIGFVRLYQGNLKAEIRENRIYNTVYSKFYPQLIGAFRSEHERMRELALISEIVSKKCY